MAKRILFYLVLIFLMLIVTLVAAEVVARLVTSTDENGNVYFKNQQLLPYRFPVRSTRSRIQVYEERSHEAYVVDHPLLGWTIGPDRSSENGLYHSNSQGIRSAPREYSSSPSPDTLRVALFGDSFTHGDEEPWHNTWASFLERYLNRAGIRAEVLNFGVGGYCFSQAYLRWLHQGREFKPHIVVIGFQSENMRRTVNIFRSLYSSRTGLVFSKPRHILNKQGDLEVINCPVIPPRDVPDYLRDFSNRPLSRYEFWFNPDNYRAPFWTRSRLGQLLYNRDNSGERDRRTHEEIAENGGTPEDVTLALIKSWSAGVREEGGISIVLHLPRRDHLRLLSRDQIPAYYSLFDQMRASGIEVVDPGPALLVDRRGLYLRSHYSAAAGKIIARVLSGRIEELLEETGERERFRRDSPVATEDDLLKDADETGGMEIDIGGPEDSMFILEGFHNSELFQDRTLSRWTQGRAVLRLPLALPAGTGATLEIHLVSWGPPGYRLEAELDGVALDEIRSDEGRLRFRIPASENTPRVAELTLNGPTWSPAESRGVADHRRLGVMIDKILLIPDA